MTHFTQQFQEAIYSTGLISPDTVIPDGKLHRFSSNGKPRDTAGWYVLHDGRIPAGAFGDWRTGLRQNWRVDLGRQFTLEERTAYIAKQKVIQIEYEADKQRGYEQAAQEASKLWESGIPATSERGYLKCKQIHPHGTKVSLEDVDVYWFPCVIALASSGIWNGLPQTNRPMVALIKRPLSR